MQVLQIILIVITLLGLIFGKWVGKLLGKILIPVVSNPYGAVIITIALLIFMIGLINWLIGLGRIDRRGK